MTKLYAKIKGARAISLFDFPKTWQVCCGHWVCNTHWWNCSVILCLIALAFPEDRCDCISLQGLQRSSCISSAGVVQSGQQVLLALYCFLRELWSRYGSYSPLCSFSKLCNFQCDIKSHIYVCLDANNGINISRSHISKPCCIRCLSSRVLKLMAVLALPISAGKLFHWSITL